MATSMKAKKKWEAEAYDTFTTRIKKGQKDIVKNFVAEQGMSLNAYINQLLEKDLQAHGIVFDPLSPPLKKGDTRK